MIICMIRIYEADTALLPDEKAVLRNIVFLDEARKQKVWQCRNLEDKKRSLLAGYLIQAGVKEWMTEESGLQRSAKPLSLSYFYSEYGKPYLKGKENLYFNISHSGNYVVCAFSDYEVGIDIQIHKKWKVELDQRFFSVEDRELMERMPERDAADVFFHMWTVKEAYMKLTGEGMRQGLDATVIEIQEKDNSRKEYPEQGRIRKKEEKGQGAYFKIYEEYDKISKYSMAVCSGRPLGEIQKKKICF